MNREPAAAVNTDEIDVERAFVNVVQKIDAHFPLSPLPVAPELAEPSSFLKILKARHQNWQAPGFRKIFGMRFTVKLPALDQMNVIIYPQPQYETPIFLMFCLVTGRKVICHVNVNCTASSPAYLERWVEPLVALRARHGDFSCDDRYPEWMLRWRTPAGVYGMFPKARGGDFIACGMDYLGAYLELAARQQPVTDPTRLAEIAAAHAQFVSDIRTQDKAQGMIARMIGAEKARRIFWEVTT
jgi:hypothetical protein